MDLFENVINAISHLSTKTLTPKKKKPTHTYNIKPTNFRGLHGPPEAQTELSLAVKSQVPRQSLLQILHLTER